MKFINVAIVLASVFLSIPVFAKEPIRSFDCMTSRIIDGDTIACVVKNSGGTEVKIRLYGIDAPETEKVNHKSHKVSKPGQPFGDKSEEALDKKIGNQAILKGLS